MKNKRILSLLVACVLLLGATVLPVWAAEAGQVVTTAPTGYTTAEEVVYQTHQKGNHQVLANWGARGEDCVFLTIPAIEYYAADIAYDVLSDNAGGTSQTDAYQSDLYLALKAMMTAKHTYITTYQETRPLYAYTDCVSNQTDQLVSFYSGKLHTSVWDQGDTWNREHTWPNSKGLDGTDENDIMMLRPTLKNENGSRGNKAYGESATYFDPGISVRGDCARIVLYVYTRWGNTGKMWGSSGVMENVDILLKWMAEDPVDTWEMGRNDSVESITGVRNVFIDYPEYAWLLFGREIPEDLVTPSGIAMNGEPADSETESVTTEGTETTDAIESTTDAIESTTDAETEPETAIASETGFTTEDSEPIVTQPIESEHGTTEATQKPAGCTATVWSGMGLVCLAGAAFVLARKRAE